MSHGAAPARSIPNIPKNSVLDFDVPLSNQQVRSMTAAVILIGGNHCRRLTLLTSL